VNGASRRGIGIISVCLYASLGLMVWERVPIFGAICAALAVIRCWVLIRQWDR
jgi:hypothetical protein